MNITAVEIYLDDNIPECMDGIMRIGSVKIHANDNVYDYDDLVDNTEFYSEKEIEEYVNKHLGIDFAEVIE